MSVLIINLALRYLMLISSFIGALLFGLCLMGLRFNLTDSIPQGFYWQVEKMVRKGNYVAFCPIQTHLFRLAKDRGYIRESNACEGHYAYLMKRVAALPGDVLSINQSGVWINGKLWPHSQPRPTDKYKRVLTPFTPSDFIVEKTQVVLMGETIKSFDARYVGPIPSAQIQGVLIPLLTW